MAEEDVPPVAATDPINYFSSVHAVPAQLQGLIGADRQQLAGLCGGALSGNAFTGGLMDMGTGDPASPGGAAGDTLTGTQSFLDQLCGMASGDPAATGSNPQAVLLGAADVNDTVNNTPMAAGTIELGQNGQPSGNVALDAINGVQNLANTMYGILAGCGCGEQNDPAGVSPQQVIDTTQETADGVTSNPMASGIIALGQTEGGSGNVALDAINGAQALADSLYGMMTGCGCGTENDPANVTPGQVVDTAQQTTDAYNNSAMATGIVGIGQADGGSGNVAVDAINGGQTLIDALCSICSVFGCSFGSPVELPAGGGLGEYVRRLDSFATQTTPQDILTGAQDAADAVVASPYASQVLDLGPQDTGNVAVKTVMGASTAMAINNAQQATAASLTSAQSVAVATQNMLVAQDFDSPYSMNVAGDAHWSHDPNRSARVAGMGSARCIVDGTQDPLVSSEIAVVAGETVEVAAKATWSGLLYTGTNPVSIGVQKYRRSKPGGAAGVLYVDIGPGDVVGGAVESPSSDETWTDLAGTYVVEPGVDQVRIVCKVAETATSGWVNFDDAALLKTDLIASAAVPGVGNTVDAIVANLYGAAGAGFTSNQAAVALGNTAAQNCSAVADIAALQAEGHTGAIAGDDFSWLGDPVDNEDWDSTLIGETVGGAPLVTTGLGGYLADGTEMAWTPGSYISSARMSEHFIWAGTDNVSDTDYQLIQIVLSSALTTYWFGNPYSGVGLTAWVYLFGRCGVGGYIRAGFSSETAENTGRFEVGYDAGDGFVVMTSGTCAPPGTGSLLSLYCGVLPSGSRQFKLQSGTSIIADFTETGTTSLLGAAQRGYGWGGKAELSTSHSSVPPRVTQWLAMDQ